ncbi:MAG: hypothetical protein NT011_12465 [Kiritimatiellaeota bacterium]|nr:hypothetical protein [Kiritimatiellota bacterium]
MAMNLRERILTVYRGATPDVVPYMLDLSHWFYHKNHLPWDLSKSYDQPEYELIDYHKKVGAGFYLPNLGAMYSATYPADVVAEMEKKDSKDAPEITWRFRTPLGTIERTRVWEEQTYAWGMKNWCVSTEQNLKALGYAMGGRTFSPCWDKYRMWTESVGDTGVVYLVIGYSAMGYILNYWMGIEQAMYAANDWPDTLHAVVDQINANLLQLIDLAAASPAEVILLGDNFSSDIQPPYFFNEWTRPYYAEAIRRLHAAGKHVAVHIDGRLRGALRMIRETAADCGDAITPRPTGDLTPAECRAEAGPDFILSGGVSPNLWLPNIDISEFKRAVLAWLETKQQSSRLIANAGDQVPPGAAEERIEIMRDMVAKHGRF